MCILSFEKYVSWRLDPFDEWGKGCRSGDRAKFLCLSRGERFQGEAGVKESSLVRGEQIVTSQQKVEKMSNYIFLIENFSVMWCKFSPISAMKTPVKHVLLIYLGNIETTTMRAFFIWLGFFC